MTTLSRDVEQSAVSADTTPDDRTGLTRRVFGVLIGATVASTVGVGGLLAAGLTNGTSSSPSGVMTSFGSVRLTEAERQLRFPPADGPGGSDKLRVPGAAHSGHGTAIVGNSVQPTNNTWGEHLALRLEVRNDSDRRVLFAPGQLRLRIGSYGPTVTNRDAEAVTGPLPAESTSYFWINFLVPSESKRMLAEFTDPWGRGEPLALNMPLVLTRPGWLAMDHD